MMNKWDIENSKREACERAEARGEARGLKAGEAKGRKEGEAKGLEKGKLEVARAMLAKGLDVSVIAECTGLPVETVKGL